LFAPTSQLVLAVAVTSLVLLGILGAIGARLGGSSIARGILRVTFWGALALVLTAVIGGLVSKYG